MRRRIGGPQLSTSPILAGPILALGSVYTPSWLGQRGIDTDPGSRIGEGSS